MTPALTPEHHLLVAFVVAMAVGASSGCTCDHEERSEQGEVDTRPRTAWLEACVPAPQQFWGDLQTLAGTGFRGARLPSTLDGLASALSDLPPDHIEGAIDWTSPVLVTMYEPPEGRPVREAFVLRARRNDAKTRTPGLSGSGRRELTTRRGQKLYVDFDATSLSLAASEWALSAMRAERDDVCAAGGEAIEIRVAKALVASPQVVSWVERRGAALEASARQATAQRGRPTLGDPEVLARMLARWGERSRERIEGSAPLTISLSADGEVAQILVEGQRAAARSAPTKGSSSRDLLQVIPPDVYLAVVSEATADERRRQALDLVDALAKVAGDRMPATERSELETTFSTLATTVDGRIAFGLRPALEPGPLVGLAALEASDPAAAAEALSKVAARFGQGSLGNMLEHLGAHVEVGEERPEGDAGALPFEVTPPADVSEDRGEVTRRLLSPSPTLAWRREEHLLLVAFGPEPVPELARLTEATTDSAATSVLAQTVLARAEERTPRSELVCYGWTPAIAGLLTSGGPGAGSLPPGGFALTVGEGGDDGNRWRAALLLDGEQLESLLLLITGEGS